MNQNIRFSPRINIALTSALVIVVALSGAGCKRKPKGPTAVTTAPRAAPTSTQESHAAEIKRKLADLKPIPQLIDGVNFTDPNGEIWIRYPNGIMIHDLHREDDEGPEFGQTVSISYIGTLPGSNQEFDRAGKDHPLSFALGSKGIVAGLSMGISTMHIGGKRRIFIPPELAYGAEGRLPTIAPNQALIFEVELLSISGEAIDPLADLPDTRPMGPNLPAATTTAPATNQ